jgi:hypothetical protein
MIERKPVVGRCVDRDVWSAFDRRRGIPPRIIRDRNDRPDQRLRSLLPDRQRTEDACGPARPQDPVPVVSGLRRDRQGTEIPSFCAREGIAPC